MVNCSTVGFHRNTVVKMTTAVYHRQQSVICLTSGKFGLDWALLVSPCLFEESQYDRNIVDWAVKS